MAYDRGRDRIVLFGGVDCIPGSSEALGDTWEFDGTNWSMRPTASAPASRSGHLMAYDRRRGVTVLFGGDLQSPYRGFPPELGRDTWEWDGLNWRNRTPSVSPGATDVATMAYDPIRQRTVLVGEDGTWEWDGAVWLQVAPPTAGPEGRGATSSWWSLAPRTDSV